MAKAKQPELTPSDQHKLFQEAARDLGCDDSEEAFDRALKKIASAPPPKSVQKRKAKPKRRA
jgi:hypothetical protein